jgi:hypothetical protein
MNATAPEAVVEGIAWPGAVSVLVGESAAGKTFALLDLAAAVSAGRDWHGRRARQSSVVYFGFEGDVRLRLRALRDVAGHSLENVFIVSAGDTLSPTTDRERDEVPSRGELAAARDLDEIGKFIEAREAPSLGLVIIDTVRASLAGSEDSSESVSAYLRAVRRLLTHAPGAAALLAHHSGWQDSAETRRKRERGSSAFRGNVDASFYLEVTDLNQVTGQACLALSTLKVRDGELAPPLRLIRQPVTIPGIVDQWGEPATTCLISADRRTREEREAEEAKATEAELLKLDLRILGIVAHRPDLTSKTGIRATAGVSRDAAYAAIERLVTRGWLFVPGKKGNPYKVTEAGSAELGDAEPHGSSPSS